MGHPVFLSKKWKQNICKNVLRIEGLFHFSQEKNTQGHLQRNVWYYGMSITFVGFKT